MLSDVASTQTWNLPGTGKHSSEEAGEDHPRRASSWHCTHTLHSHASWEH
jgi:hypothetical protein